MFKPPQILVAMPSLRDGYFDKSVVLLCEYGDAGAMGFVVNSPSNTTVDDLLCELNLNTNPKQEQVILIGGPVQPELCWVVHTPDFQGRSTTAIGKDLALSAAQEVLTELTEGKVPEFYMVGVGYAGWGAAQLDREIEEDAWWLADLDVMSILAKPHPERWNCVMKTLGLDPYSAATRQV